MSSLEKVPSHLMFNLVFPLLAYNDVLRLRRVSRQMKDVADNFMWRMTTSGSYEGEWTLDASRDALRSFVSTGRPPPPSRLRVTITTKEKDHSPFFEDDQLIKFLHVYGKYVTSLEIDTLRIPCTSHFEINFYQSLVNLSTLSVNAIETVGGAVDFQERTINSTGGFLILPALANLTSLSINGTDSMDSMWVLINSVAVQLSMLSHPFESPRLDNVDFSDSSDDESDTSVSSDDDDNNYGGDSDSDIDVSDSEQDDVVPKSLKSIIAALVERKSRHNSNVLIYDWYHVRYYSFKSSELTFLLHVFRRNGVLIKNFHSHLMDLIPIRRQRFDRGLINWKFQNIIQTIVGVDENLLSVELPALEQVILHTTGNSGIYLRRDCTLPEWPNLKKIYVHVDNDQGPLVDFLCGNLNVQRTKLEELKLDYVAISEFALPLPIPAKMAYCCVNLKKLTVIRCRGKNDFFIALWKSLPLLEELTVSTCQYLSHDGFVGDESEPAFLNLKYLKRFRFRNINSAYGLTNETFTKVFREMKLLRFELSSVKHLKTMTLDGVNSLLDGPFGESIQVIKLDHLFIKGVSEREMKDVVSKFRCVNMI